MSRPGPAPIPSRRPRAERVGAIDIAASALARVLPRRLEPAVSQARLDARSLLAGLRGDRAPSFSTPQRPPAAPTPLDAIDPVVELLPRGLGDRYLALRRDVAMVRAELRGHRAPSLIPRDETPTKRSRYAVGAPAAQHDRSLRVVRVIEETASARTLELVDVSGSPFTFQAGQFLTLHVVVEGRSYRRAYSLSSSPDDGHVRVTIKRIEGGRVSTHLVDTVRAGDVLTAHGPSGSFVVPPGRSPRHLVLFAGGSGITPIASIARDVLGREPGARLTLVYGNRSERDTIFRAELEALARDGRLRVVHVLSEPEGAAPCVAGIPDERTVDRLVDELSLLDRLPGEDAPLYFVCGPSPMMAAVRAALEGRRVPPESIFEERFLSPADPTTRRAAAGPQLVSIRMGGATRAVTVAPGKTVLEAALAEGIALPFSCQMGGCGACKCRSTGGELVMDEPNCLSDREKAAGMVLTCVARPMGPSAIEEL
jgi:ferredoxin-NADP reductase